MTMRSNKPELLPYNPDSFVGHTTSTVDENKHILKSILSCDNIGIFRNFNQESPLLQQMLY